MYLCDFINVDGQRHFISADTRTGQFRIELVTHSVFEQFVRNILSIGEDRALPESGFKKASEVLA